MDSSSQFRSGRKRILYSNRWQQEDRQIRWLLSEGLWVRNPTREAKPFKHLQPPDLHQKYLISMKCAEFCGDAVSPWKQSHVILEELQVEDIGGDGERTGILGSS